MFLKVMLGNGSYTIYERVRNLNAVINQSFLEVPEEFFQLFKEGDKLDPKEENELTAVFRDWILAEAYHRNSSVGVVNGSIETTCVSDMILIDSNKSNPDANAHRFKLVFFDSGEVSYYIVTDCPIFICNDEGKTIETVRNY